MNKQKQNTHSKYYSDGKGVGATRRYTYKRSSVGTSPLAIELGMLVRIYKGEAGTGLLRPALAFSKCSRTESFIISCPVITSETIMHTFSEFHQIDSPERVVRILDMSRLSSKVGYSGHNDSTPKQRMC